MGQRRADPGGGRGRLNDATQTRRAPKGGRPRRVLPALCAALFAWPLSAQTPEFGAGVQRPAEVRIGVLAHRGWGREAAGWAPLAAHLDAALPGRSVRLVPVTLSSAGPLIDRGGLHFLVTNPGHDVARDREHRLSPIATRLRRLSDGSRTTEFGSALVVRADSPLETLEDTAGARAAAVDPRAFGGYRLAWRALTERGVDPARDFAELAFLGFPQDRIVEAVLKGEADLGIVRSGLLERMEAEGAVPEGALRVLNANVTYTYPDAVSTRLYPEWPVLAMGGTERALRDRVALALLSAGPEPAVQWSAPVSYRDARALHAAFTAPPPQAPGPGRAWIAGTGALAALLALVALLGRRALRRASPPGGRRRPDGAPHPAGAAGARPHRRGRLYQGDRAGAGHQTQDGGVPPLQPPEGVRGAQFRAAGRDPAGAGCGAARSGGRPGRRRRAAPGTVTGIMCAEWPGGRGGDRAAPRARIRRRSK